MCVESSCAALTAMVEFHSMTSSCTHHDSWVAFTMIVELHSPKRSSCNNHDSRITLTAMVELQSKRVEFHSTRSSARVSLTTTAEVTHHDGLVLLTTTTEVHSPRWSSCPAAPWAQWGPRCRCWAWWTGRACLAPPRCAWQWWTRYRSAAWYWCHLIHNS